MEIDYRLLVEMHNDNLALMDGTTAPIKRIFADHDLVFGMWPDAAHAQGFDMLVVKGAKLLKEGVASGQTMRCRVDVIPCECYEQALAAKGMFGDRDHDA